MKARDVMEALGISKMTLHNYVKSGKIKVDKVVNSRVIEYNADSVENLASSGGVKSAKSGIIIYRNGRKMEIKLDEHQLDALIDVIKSQFMS